MKKIKWQAKAEAHDFPAADSYLSIIYPEAEVKKLVTALKKAKVVKYKAKDIFRASSLSLLGLSNSHVKMDRAKIKKGTPLSPILLVRDPANGRVVIADGYHRLCAVYSFAEDAVIPCQIV